MNAIYNLFNKGISQTMRYISISIKEVDLQFSIKSCIYLFPGPQATNFFSNFSMMQI